MQNTKIYSFIQVVAAHKLAFVKAQLPNFVSQLTNQGYLAEIILVCHGLADQAFDDLKQIAITLPTIQIYRLQQPATEDVAILAGLNNAIGDNVATTDMLADAPQTLINMVSEQMRSGADVILTTGSRPEGSWLYALASNIYNSVFSILNNFKLSEETPVSRLFSRAVVNDIINHDQPLITLNVVSATSGFSKSFAPRVPSATNRLSVPLRERIGARWLLLISLNAFPLRMANLLCGVGALFSMGYSLYTVVVFLFKDNIMPGWTTVSLMLSGMFFLISLVLWMISEYLLLNNKHNNGNLYQISAEHTSNALRGMSSLNVEMDK